MIDGAESRTQFLAISSDTIELGHREAQNMDSQIKEYPASEITHQLVNEQFELATEVIFRQAGRSNALLADRIGLNTAGNSEAPGSRSKDASTSSADNRYNRYGYRIKFKRRSWSSGSIKWKQMLQE